MAYAHADVWTGTGSGKDGKTQAHTNMKWTYGYYTSYVKRLTQRNEDAQNAVGEFLRMFRHLKKK